MIIETENPTVTVGASQKGEVKVFVSNGKGEVINVMTFNVYAADWLAGEILGASLRAKGILNVIGKPSQ